AGAARPDVARTAADLGYLYGPYDCYDSVHSPHAKNTWETAQFDADLFAHGGVVDEHGKPRGGFQQAGHVLSAAAARPYLEKRVSGMLAKVPYTLWFMDCDGAGQYFDDYSPEHPASQAQDCAARIDRLNWITSTFGLPIGSEGASATTAGRICFAHGMLSGAIGWADKDHSDEHSKWWLGTYWPPEEPEYFFRRCPLKPRFRIEQYDPRFRLPLYETAMHDAVIATHHWETPSLKFKDEIVSSALMEQLYNVPALYHLTKGEFARIKKGLLAHYRFFSPLHRRLGLQPLTEFRWLTPDRLVQRTTFGDGTTLTANFRKTPWTGDGLTVPAGSVVAASQGYTETYTPAY
ncbi:MAG: glycoside hydrolase, partial [bacterium]